MVSVADGPWRATKGSHELDGPRPEKFKMDFSIGHSRLSGSSIRQGKFYSQLKASLAHFGRVVKRFLDADFTDFHRYASRRPHLCDFPSGGCYKLNMTPDQELLRRYVQTRSEEAFAELVRRHVNLVYSAALRQVKGDAHLAQDVAQTVFSDLARKAGSLTRRESLTGWLYASTHFAAAKIVRTETRRRNREDKFMREPLSDTALETDWEKTRPALDAAMHKLNESDREAILLRFFENRQFAEVGAKLGLNENAARMRVERALEKLRAIFAKRGITTAAALASVISANAVQMAPAGLATTLTTTSIATVGTGTTFTLLKFMTATHIKLGLSVLVVAGAATALVVQHQTQTELRDENQSLRQQIAQLQMNNESLSNRLSATADAKSPPARSLSDEEMNELLRLRGEVGMLQRQANEAEQKLATALSARAF
jgi:RNA polymerase sigma factor (sigma-70 family)